MGVDADSSLNGGTGMAGGFGNLIRQATAIGIAEDDARGTGVGGGAETGCRIGGVFLPAVNRMLAVVDDLTAMGLQESDRVGNHRQVFFGRAAQDFPDVQGGSLTVNSDNRGLDLEQAFDLCIFGGADALLAGGAECRELGMLELQLAGFVEELDVTRVGTGPAALDISHPEALELLSNAQLVGDREMNPQTLRAVAEGGVIDFDFSCHSGGGGKKCKRGRRSGSRGTGSRWRRPVQRA